MLRQEIHWEKQFKELSGYLKEFITLNKLRNTPERYEILESALDLEYTHPASNAQMLYAHHSTQGYVASRNSIYNALNLFEEASILIKLPETAEGSNYCFTYRTSGNMLMICRRCGNISFYKRKRELIQIKHIVPPRFNVTNPVIILYGICIKCKKIKKK